MAYSPSPVERAQQILEEIELEERLKKQQNKANDPKGNNTDNEVSAKATLQQKKDTPVVTPEIAKDNILQPKTINLSNLKLNDLQKGIVLTEILNKPLALRRHRRF